MQKVSLNKNKDQVMTTRKRNTLAESENKLREVQQIEDSREEQMKDYTEVETGTGRRTRVR